MKKTLVSAHKKPAALYNGLEETWMTREPGSDAMFENTQK